MMRVSFLTCAGLGAIAAVLATPASAQDAGGAAAGGDIIVTARRTDERLQDVPISITVLNQQSLQNRNVLTAGDLAATTPSLAVNSNFGTDNTTFSLRGFNQDVGTNPTVGVYFADVVALRGGNNGTVVGDGAGAGSLFDLQNVQVLKGPQGTLQGRNTTGGAVLLVPQKPTDKLEGYLEGSLGDYRLKGIEGVINIPLGDTFKMRLGFDRQSRGGYITNHSGIGPSTFGNVDFTALRASFIADLSPDLQNYTIVSFSHSKNNGSAQKLIATTATPEYPVYAGNVQPSATQQLLSQSHYGFYDIEQDVPNSAVDTKQWQVINTTTWLASDALTVKNIASYGELRQNSNTAIFATNYIAQNGERFDYANNHPAPGLDNAAQSTFTEELQFQGTVGGDKLHWQGGFYFEKSSPLGASGVQSSVDSYCPDISTTRSPTCTNPYPSLPLGPGLILPASSGYNYQVARTSTRDVAAYAQATLKLTDTLKLTGGIRYTWDKTSADAIETFTTDQGVTCIHTLTLLPAGSTCPDVIVSQKSKAPTWLIDLDYKPIRDVLIYAKYSRGYRAGGVKPDAPDFGGVDLSTFQPEKLDAYEAGLKSTFRGLVRGTFNLAGFYNNFSNQQVQFGLSPSNHFGAPLPPSSAPINLGKTRIWGIEADATVHLFQGFTVDAGYAYLNSKAVRVASPTLAGFTAFPLAVQGQPLNLSPKNKATVTGTYTLPLDEKIGRISLSATFTHTDSQRATYGDYLGGLVASGQQLVAGAPGTLVVSYTDYGILPATDLLNVAVNWKGILGSQIDAAFFATNVTNQHYWTWSPGVLTTGQEFIQLGTPRMFGFRAKMNF